MSNKQTKDPKAENTNAGGHVGGTHFGQEPDAKTRTDKVGDKARPNDGSK